ncbi:ATP-binding protein [Dyella mobilis]|uniref:AAA family ATPase n=1 Tax=Dyella mobilis TaxID=1849582 RepID=A0ABS2KFK2_9GAMM|nr:AAA family ATPase [Dyella mobilis]MBM7129945.1 AAA family ATPase [Dyella mobilis]GLQ97792.1 MoxR-like ATPase [Dyella mobilis]
MNAAIDQPILRALSEQVHAQELQRLAQNDKGARPPGWALTPRSVRAFIVGDDKLGVRTKFFGDNALVDRCIVTLMSNRGLLLVGEPGTAKSMLSELLAAAISGNSTCTIQGTAGITEDQIKYSWNYALLLAEGPSARSLVRGPLYDALAEGKLCRFEEITRVQPEVQDCLISLLSDKLLHIPELDGEASIVFAKPGFNLLATANIRDRGVHEMSSALKRRFNFETVRPINDRKLESRLVRDQTEALLGRSNIDIPFDGDIVELLVTAFNDLRHGVTAEGVVVEKPTAVMSSAEAVAVGYAASLDAHYFGDGSVGGEHIARQLIGTVLKDNPEDGKKLRHYFDVVVKQRAQKNKQWKRALEARGELER